MCGEIPVVSPSYSAGETQKHRHRLQVQTIAKEDSAGRGGCFVADIFVGE